MYSFKQYQSACIGVAVFIGMLGLLVPHASYGAPAKDVNVVNTANVNVVGGAIAADVTVVNDGTNPVPVLDVDSPARQPFAVDVTLTFEPTDVSTQDFSTTVPADKILVIEHVTLRSVTSFSPVPADAALSFTISMSTNGSFNAHFFSLPDKHVIFTGGNNFLFTLSQPVRLYADPNSIVNLDVRRNFTNNVNMNDQIVEVSISGHFVDP